MFEGALAMGLKAALGLLLTVGLLAGCAAVPPGTEADRNGWVMQRTMLPHPQQPGNQIELLRSTAGHGNDLIPEAAEPPGHV
jgi:hypothetical protein